MISEELKLAIEVARVRVNDSPSLIIREVYEEIIKIKKQERAEERMPPPPAPPNPEMKR